jgi:hypothetical protein
MTIDRYGPGVAAFWRIVEQGNEPDLARLARQYPEEALALANALEQWVQQSAARARERMWHARNMVLRRGGEPLSLGGVMRERRQGLGLSEAALAARLKAEGTPVVSHAVRMLESDQQSPLGVKPIVWRGLTQVLEMDPAYLMSLLELAMAQPREAQPFTRMARGATSEDRAEFLAETSAGLDDQSRAYLVEVRRALGLPAPYRDLTQ